MNLKIEVLGVFKTCRLLDFVFYSTRQTLIYRDKRLLSSCFFEVSVQAEKIMALVQLCSVANFAV